MKRRQLGYSLVEVLIAMAITSVVLLTVVTLFYMGQRNVYSGKQMTYAVSVGTRILEDLSSMTATDVETNFNINDTTTLTSVPLYGVSLPTGLTIPNSALVDTTGCTGSGSPVVWTCTNDTGGYLAQWKGLIDESKLANATVGLVLTPTDPANPSTCPNCPWTTARFLKVRAFVRWDEAANRQRIAFFDTTRTNRD
jgi:prepilin-type N-terminal cleavage/methylation domain-containing protein